MNKFIYTWDHSSADKVTLKNFVFEFQLKFKFVEQLFERISFFVFFFAHTPHLANTQTKSHII